MKCSVSLLATLFGILLFCLGARSVPAQDINLNISGTQGYDDFGTALVNGPDSTFLVVYNRNNYLMGASGLEAELWEANGTLLWSVVIADVSTEYAKVTDAVYDPVREVFYLVGMEGGCDYEGGNFIVQLDADGTINWTQELDSSGINPILGLLPQGAGVVAASREYENTYRLVNSSGENTPLDFAFGTPQIRGLAVVDSSTLLIATSHLLLTYDWVEEEVLAESEPGSWFDVAYNAEVDKVYALGQDSLWLLNSALEVERKVPNSYDLYWDYIFPPKIIQTEGHIIPKLGGHFSEVLVFDDTLGVVSNFQTKPYYQYNSAITIGGTALLTGFSTPSQAMFPYDIAYTNNPVPGSEDILGSWSLDTGAPTWQGPDVLVDDLVFTDAYGTTPPFGCFNAVNLYLEGVQVRLTNVGTDTVKDARVALGVYSCFPPCGNGFSIPAEVQLQDPIPPGASRWVQLGDIFQSAAHSTIQGIRVCGWAGAVNGQMDEDFSNNAHCLLLQDIPLSSQEPFELPTVTVFPNPVGDYLHLELGEPLFSSVPIQLYDPFGRIVRTEMWSVGQRDFSWELADLPSGAYVLRMEGVATKAVVKF